MTADPFLDLHPDDARWAHGEGPGAHGVKLHYVRQGQGSPVVLLHGWPGFWYDWRRVVPALAPVADVIAPDLRGFGRSDKPDLPPEEGYTPLALAADVFALIDHLAVERPVVVAHDIGATVAQAMALSLPERIRALVLLNPPYLGIGNRWFEPAAQRELWYQHLHAQPWSHLLVGHDRETVKIYLSHFYDRWAGKKEAVRPAELEAIVDAYARPGAVEGGFNYYRARWLTRYQDFPQEEDPREFNIRHPTLVLWGDADPLLPFEWSDRLTEYFPGSKLRRLPGVGHFVPFEAPDEVVDGVRGMLEGTP